MLQHLVKQHNLPISQPIKFDCFSCNVEKSRKLPFLVSDIVSSAPFDLLHLDVWSPAPVPSFQGYRYYLLVLDDFTKYMWLLPLHYKSDVKAALTNFIAYVNTQFHSTPKIVRSDNGGEFVDFYLVNFFLRMV